MEISTFELLVKRIAPKPTPAAIARRVVQGYFLTITNLESKELTFRVRFNISKPNPVDPDRTLFNNVDLRYDIAGDNNLLPLSGNANSTIFAVSFVLPARQTASLQLLPKASLFADENAPADPDFEVRGYVTLRLPLIKSQPQSDKPVKVLINPEIRGTFIPNGFPKESTGDFDQINYPLAIASGKALNEIVSDQLIKFPPLPIESPISDDVEFLLEDADELEKSQTFLELMAQVDKDPKNLENLTEALFKSNIPIRVSPV